MKTEQLMESMNSIDDKLLARSEKTGYYRRIIPAILAAAACFGIITAASLTLPKQMPLEETGDFGDHGARGETTGPSDLDGNGYHGADENSQSASDSESSATEDESIVGDKIRPVDETETQLTYEQAKADTDFGVYFLKEVPTGFAEENIIRTHHPKGSDFLSGLWTKGYDEISWRVTEFGKDDAMRLTSVEQKENYDLSLYPIPRADSVPPELDKIVYFPVFEAEELTLDAVYARAYVVDDAGDSDGYRMEFAVKFGDKVVEIRAKGLSPEWIFEQIKALL